MLYAVSSRRRTVALQRQASSRGESASKLLPNSFSPETQSLSTSTTTRPNTANGFKHNIPSTPYKKLSTTERIEHIQSTFMLEEHDLQYCYRAFCYMAAKKDNVASPSSVPMSAVALSTKKKKKKNRFGKATSSSDTVTTSLIADTIPQRPWEVDDDKVVTLSISDFFVPFQPAQRTNNGGYMDGIFDLCGTKDLHAIDFAEFVESICTFGMFKLDDMIKFVFFILDKSKEGLIPRFQLLRFVESLHGKKALVFEQVILPPSSHNNSNNVDDCCSNRRSLSRRWSKDDTTTNIRLPAAERRRASVDYNDLKRLCTDYPTMLEPMLLFQTTLRRRIFGEKWWKRKEYQIQRMMKEKNLPTEEKKKQPTGDDNGSSKISFFKYWIRRLLSSKSTENE